VKTLIGIVLGLCSGFLIYMIAAMLVGPKTVSNAFVAVTFLGGWAVSSFLLIRGARSVSKVFSRAFLLGAAEWLAVIPAGLVLSGQAYSETVGQAGGAGASDAGQAGAAMGAGCISILTGGFAVAMAIVCLIGFAVSYFIGREMKPEAVALTRKCPECAELIQTEARKCRHCGAVLATPAAPEGSGMGGAA
jgi:predicted RNA-binding Zn-ribbon protein involved in translation (DUF1610 family)